MRSLRKALARIFRGPLSLQCRASEPMDLRPDVFNLSRCHKIAETFDNGFRDADVNEGAFLMESLNANLGSPYGTH